MAKHLVSPPPKPSPKGKKKSKKKATALPRLVQWKMPSRRRFCYIRDFSVSEMAPVLAAVVLFLAASVAPISSLLKLIAYAVTAFVAGFSILRRSFLKAVHGSWPDEDILLLLAAFHPHSPLISLTGSLYPSPFLHGLPFVVCFGLMLVAYVYGVLTRRITSLSSFRHFLGYGYERYGALMVLSMLLSFIFHCSRYVFY